MTIAQNITFNEAALTARRDFLDLGSGNAKIQIYAGTRPAGGGSPSGSMLGEITLDRPCGVVNAGQLVLTSAVTPVASNSGTAVWARIVNASGTWAFDCDVSNMAGSGEVKLSNTLVLAGAELTLIQAILG